MGSADPSNAQTSLPLIRKALLAESITLGIRRKYHVGAADTTGNNNRYTFPQGCQFSPDGTCLLTSRENRLELYNTPYSNEKNIDDDENDENGIEKNKEKNDDNCTSASTTTDNQPKGCFKDQHHRLIETNAANFWEPALIYKTGDAVRCYAWYPYMRSSDPATCCFVGVSRDSPIHLYDAYDGRIRATYAPYNRLDEMESPTTLCFVEKAQKIVTGGLKTDRLLHVFDINRPGREHSLPALKLGKTRRSKDGQKGLVSAMAYSEDRGVLAVGTYSPGSIYLYDLRSYSKSPAAEVIMSSCASASSFGGSALCVVGHGKRNKKRKRLTPIAMDDNINENADKSENSKNNNNGSSSIINFAAAKKQWYSTKTRGGVTQVEFDCTGNYLFSTSRRANAILQWDVRKTSSNYCPGVASFETDNDTNQRIGFQIFGEEIWIGGKDKCVRVYNYKESNKDVAKITGFRDCVNGISLHSNDCVGRNHNDINTVGGMVKNNPLLAVSIGTRHFPSAEDWESDKPHSAMTVGTPEDGSVQVYSLRF